MKIFSRSIQATGNGLLLLATIGLSGCYEPEGVMPEPRKAKETKLWTDAEVDAVAEMTYITIDGGEPVTMRGSPAACDKVSFLRFRNINGPTNAEQADAAFLMVPGILEGANGFEFIGRQMVYMAEKEYGKNIEVWAMDRRANCLEDLTGMEAADLAATSTEAEDILAGYYYNNQEINGKTFEGFLLGSDLGFLYEFGVRQVTLDMKAILDHMMPTPGVSQQKAFVGGHSLGGIHTSIFLSWDFDGDASTLNDAGYNLVAGAFGFDTQVAPLDTGSFFGTTATTMTKNLMSEEDQERLNEVTEDSDSGYKLNLKLLKLGVLPRIVNIPALFTPEVLALPELVGIPASKNPTAEATMYTKIPHSAALYNIVNVVHSRGPLNVGIHPLIENFRYTNRAYVGQIFDDQFQQLSFLKLGLGFMDGGPITRKWKVLGDGSGSGGMFGSNKLFIAGNAGPDIFHLNQGPLYDWASRSEIGDLNDSDFMDTTGTTQLTWLETEPVDMDDLIRALHHGPTNLTEWYFPIRIMLDINAVNKSYAADYGLQTLHPSGVANIRSLLVTAGEGVRFSNTEEVPVPNQKVIVAPGYTHMDPMFESVNSASQTSYTMRPLLDFAFQ